MVSDAVWDSREKQQQTLQMAILEHLYQQGMLSVAEELCQVTGSPGRCWACLFCFLLGSVLYIRTPLLFFYIQTGQFIYMTQTCVSSVSDCLMGMPVPRDPFPVDSWPAGHPPLWTAHGKSKVSFKTACLYLFPLMQSFLK